MVKGRDIVTFGFIPLALLIYVGNLFHDDNAQSESHWRYEFASAKAADIGNVKPNALLLGGSNVAYSLSAQQLSRQTNLSWFNLGLSSEAYSDTNYWQYVVNTLSEEQRNAVVQVVYSSLGPMRSGLILNRLNESGVDVYGKRSSGRLPRTFFAAKIKSLTLDTRSFRNFCPLPQSRGDMDFRVKQCTDYRSVGFSRELNHEMLSQWVVRQLKSIRILFRNAKVFFVLPSEYYGEFYDADIDEQTFQFIHRTIKQQEECGKAIFLIRQPQYPTIRMICDAQHHGNQDGREWRTDNLLSSIRRVLASD